MKRNTKIILGAGVGLAVLGGIGLALGGGGVPGPDGTLPISPLSPSGTIVGYDYTIVHTGGAKEDDDVPLVLLFHGLGGTPQGILDIVQPLMAFPARVVLPVGKNAYGKNPAWWLERAATTDQAKLAAEMEWTAADFEPFLVEVARAYQRAPIVAGHSQGGMMGALLASVHPNLVESAVVASPWVPEALWASRSAPIHAAHGKADETIPYLRTRRWLEEVARLGAPAHLYPAEGGHGFQGDLLTTWALLLDKQARG